MAQKGIREYDGKKMMASYWSQYFGDLEQYAGQAVLIDSKTPTKEIFWLYITTTLSAFSIMDLSVVTTILVLSLQ